MATLASVRTILGNYDDGLDGLYGYATKSLWGTFTVTGGTYTGWVGFTSWTSTTGGGPNYGGNNSTSGFLISDTPVSTLDATNGALLINTGLFESEAYTTWASWEDPEYFYMDEGQESLREDNDDDFHRRYGVRETWISESIFTGTYPSRKLNLSGSQTATICEVWPVLLKGNPSSVTSITDSNIKILTYSGIVSSLPVAGTGYWGDYQNTPVNRNAPAYAGVLGSNFPETLAATLRDRRVGHSGNISGTFFLASKFTGITIANINDLIDDGYVYPGIYCSTSNATFQSRNPGQSTYSGVWSGIMMINNICNGFPKMATIGKAFSGSKVNRGGSWYDIIGARVNVGGTWKPVSGMKVNVGGAWQDVPSEDKIVVTGPTFNPEYDPYDEE